MRIPFFSRRQPAPSGKPTGSALTVSSGNPGYPAEDVDPLTLFDSEAASEGAPADGPGLPIAGSRSATSIPGTLVPTVNSTVPPGRPLRIGLDAVVSRRTPVFWYEAVAIVSGASANLTGTGDEELSAPDLPGILIDANGIVTVRPGSGGAEGSGARLARTLHALLPSEATPAPLRLLISKWISSSEGPVAAFAAELAYFARPEQASLVAAVYERCLATAAGGARQDVPSPAQAVKPAPPKPRSTRPKMVAAAAAAVATTAATGAWMMGGSQSWTGALAAFDFGTITETVRSIRLRSTDAGEVPSEPAATTAMTPRRAAGAGPSARQSQPTPLRTRAPRESSSADAVAAALWNARPPAAAPDPLSALGAGAVLPLVPEFSARVTVAATPMREAGAARVYSTADAGIEPPSMVYPQLPPPVYSGKGAINSMEVIVSETGAVERVRLVSTPQRMTDMMLLSGAKTWKFTPASLDGEPVRYRMVVSWAATP